MKVLTVRNVHEALPRALQLLDQEGVERPSRNGPVLLGPSVTTVYEKPCERVIFHPERDANPFFHLYEALWMLAGRRDVAGPARYAKNIGAYTDDGINFHGAYGWRWREGWGGFDAHNDQLVIIAERLKADPDDRRCVLQMWSMEHDLGKGGKDFPCNTIATFQRGSAGELNLTVFCRSNDVVWGAYGANAVQFSMLLEYLALWIGCPVGTYSQVSVNWHGYLTTLEQVKDVRPDRMGYIYNPYALKVKTLSMTDAGSIARADELIQTLLADADTGFLHDSGGPNEPCFQVFYRVLRAHHLFKTLPAPARYADAIALLEGADDFDWALKYGMTDWLVAAREWVERRWVAHELKQQS